MYIAGIMDYFSNAPRMELAVWASTLVLHASGTFGVRRQLKNARLKVGDIKPGSTGPRFWTNLALFSQFCGLVLPPFVFWTTIGFNGFRQPEWMAEYALPAPPDVFGIDGGVVGRMAGLLVFLSGRNFASTALKTLGDQYHAIGVSPLVVSWLSDVDRRLTFFWITDKGETKARRLWPLRICPPPHLHASSPFPLRWTMTLIIPVHSGALITEASFALVFWSYLPLYALLLAIGGCLLKVPIEVRDRLRRPHPELRTDYEWAYVSGKNDDRGRRAR